MLNGETVQLVKLRNPVGPGSECVGAWSNDSSEWDDLSQEERDRLDIKNLEDGEFWISYSDFIKTFTHLEVVHLDKETSRDEPSLESKTTWQMKIHQGAWRKGVSAGGCRNNPGIFNVLFLNCMNGFDLSVAIYLAAYILCIVFCYSLVVRMMFFCEIIHNGY